MLNFANLFYIKLQLYISIFLHFTSIESEIVITLVKGFTGIMCEVADPYFRKKLKVTQLSVSTSLNHKRNKWYSEECYNLRDNFFAQLNNHRKCKTEENRKAMALSRSS